MSLFAGRMAVAAGIAAGAVTKQTAAGADVAYHPPASQANGKTVYLSVACHDGNDGVPGGPCIPNHGCGDHNENNWSKAASTNFANDSGGLVERGYKVIVGTGTLSQNVANSNSSNAGTHIPVHSNADVNPSPSVCNRSTTSSFGTWAMHRPNDSNQMALGKHIVNRVGYSSFGTSDQLVARTNLGELNNVEAVASYLEADFHTWNTGVKWLADHGSWGWRVGYAVDEFWGYP